MSRRLLTEKNKRDYFEEDLSFMITSAYADDQVDPTDGDMFSSAEDEHDEAKFGRFWVQTDDKGRPVIDTDPNAKRTKGFPTRHVIHLFGSTKEGVSVHATTNFRPYHYVEFPDSWQTYEFQEFFAELNKVLFRYAKSAEDAVTHTLHKKKRFWGWEPSPSNHNQVRARTMARVTYPTMAHMKWARKLLTTSGEKLAALHPKIGTTCFVVHETQVPCTLKVMIEKGWKASSWVNLLKGSFSKRAGLRIGTCQLEVVFTKAEADNARNDIPPLLIASFDIETTNPSPLGLPPVASDPRCCTTMIGVTSMLFGDTIGQKKRVVFALNDASSDPTHQAEHDKGVLDIDIRSFNGDEKALYLAFRYYICHELDADIVTGYNINGYDYKYMCERFEKHFSKAKRSRFFHWSRISSLYAPLVSEASSSMAKGDQQSYTLPMVGRINVDVLAVVTAPGFPVRFTNHKLDTVAQELLGKSKLDMSMQDMFKLNDGVFSKRFVLANHAMTRWMIKQLLTEEHSAALHECATNLFEDQVGPFSSALPLFAFEGGLYGDTIENIRARHDAERVHTEALQQETKAHAALHKEYGEKLHTLLLQLCPSDLAYLPQHIKQALRRRLAEYCSVDCDLPLDILDNLNFVACTMQMSKLTMTLASDVVNRGQQIKIFQLLVAYADRLGYAVNEPPMSLNKKYKGATVLEPLSRFYKDPIIVLDFASLYPSIMRDEDFSPNTYVADPRHKQYTDVTYSVKTMDDGTVHTFVKNTPSVCTLVLDDVIGERKRVRGMIKLTKDPLVIRNLEAQQLACKLIANSLYGFFGADPSKSLLPCVAVAECVTAKGRQMINATKLCVESTYKHLGANVVYGDTDSVMVEFPLMKRDEFETEGQFMKRKFKLGNEISDLVTRKFQEESGKKVVVLEFEKVYWPFLLLGKKAYAARIFKSLEKPPEIDVKGLVMVKTSCCEFVRQTLECILTPLLVENSISRVVDAVNRLTVKFYNGLVHDDDFIHYVKLSATYADRTAHAQSVVADKIAKRSPGMEPRPGDMVGYLPVASGKDLCLSEIAEDADYVKENHLKIDYAYIIEKRLKNVLSDILRFLPINVKSLLEPLLQTAKQRSATCRSVMSYCEPQENKNENSRSTLKLYTITDQEADEAFKKVNQNKLRQSTLSFRPDVDGRQADDEDFIMSMMKQNVIENTKTAGCAAQPALKKNLKRKCGNVYEIDETSTSTTFSDFVPERLQKAQRTRAKQEPSKTKTANIFSFFTEAKADD